MSCKRTSSFASCLLILQNVHYFGHRITSLLTAPATGKLATDGSLALFGLFGSLMGLLSWAALFDFLNVRDRWRCEHLFSVVFWNFLCFDMVHSGFISVLKRKFGSFNNSLMLDKGTYQLPHISWRSLYRIWMGWKSHCCALGPGPGSTNCLVMCFLHRF